MLCLNLPHAVYNINLWPSGVYMAKALLRFCILLDNSIIFKYWLIRSKIHVIKEVQIRVNQFIMCHYRLLYLHAMCWHNCQRIWCTWIVSKKYLSDRRTARQTVKHLYKLHARIFGYPIIMLQCSALVNMKAWIIFHWSRIHCRNPSDHGNMLLNVFLSGNFSQH